jgi:hypothetical protein
MRRKRLWLLALLVLVAVAVVGWLVVSAPSALDEATAARIQVGMTRAEVEDLLGAPDRTGGPIDRPNKGAWVGDDFVCFVEFDAADTVRSVKVMHMAITTLDRLEMRWDEWLRTAGW